MHIDQVKDKSVPTISVVMSIYNGMSYIKEQLDSIKNQTIKPDEVLIADDCSTDETYKYVSEYIIDNNLSKTWNLEKNKANIGWKLSFRNIIHKAKSDLIFLCDQDDIWDLSKIEMMRTVFENNKKFELVACDYVPFYSGNETKRISNTLMKTMKNDGSIELITANSKFMYVLRPGCTFAIKKSLFDECFQVWENEVPHDAMLWRVAVLKGTAAYLHLPLIKWRRYSSSSSNPLSICKGCNSKYDLYFNFLSSGIKNHIVNMENIMQLRGIEDDRKNLLKKNYEFEKIYLKAVESTNILNMLMTYSKYRKFFFSFKSFLNEIKIVFEYKIH